MIMFEMTISIISIVGAKSFFLTQHTKYINTSQHNECYEWKKIQII